MGVTHNTLVPNRKAQGRTLHISRHCVFTLDAVREATSGSRGCLLCLYTCV